MLLEYIAAAEGKRSQAFSCKKESMELSTFLSERNQSAQHQIPKVFCGPTFWKPSIGMLHPSSEKMQLKEANRKQQHWIKYITHCPVWCPPSSPPICLMVYLHVQVWRQLITSLVVLQPRIWPKIAAAYWLASLKYWAFKRVFRSFEVTDQCKPSRFLIY